MISTKWLEDLGDPIKTYQVMLKKICYMANNKADYIDWIFKNYKGLRLFMIRHSVFSINAKNDPNFVVQHLLKRLMPSNEDMKALYRQAEPTDPEIKKIVDIFNGKLVMRTWLPIRLEYTNEKEVIDIIDVDFKKYVDEQESRIKNLREAEIMVL